MRLFLLVFFLVYAGMHVYALQKVRRAFSLHPAVLAVLVLFMAVMVVCPAAIRMAERQGFDLTARILSHVGYIWLGLLFLFCSWAGAFDALRLLVRVGGAVSGSDVSRLLPSARTVFLLPLALALAAVAYGAFEARQIRLEQVTIRTDKLPVGIDRLRIVQISDVHLGLIVRHARLAGIIDRIRKAEPDILVSTGDLVDGQINRLEGIAEMLAEIRPRFGKYAITGNHEMYAGLQQALAFTERAGFAVLRGGIADADVVTIAGVDDPAAQYYGGPVGREEQQLLASADRGRFVLFLKHRPLVDPRSIGLFDLQLSGHAHKGQIFPFSLLTKLYYPVDAGTRDLGSGSSLHVSRGSGTWGPPLRVLAPPEVTLIELVRP